jgi:AcrR family transcriptional regulator
MVGALVSMENRQGRGAMVDQGVVESQEPRSRKGRQTKLTLLEAAAEIFVRDSYLDARVSDISAEAGLSSGAFYRYFPDKRAIMIEVVRSFLERSDAFVRAPFNPDDPLESVRESSLRYLDFYRDNVGLWNLVYEAGQADAEIETLRLDSVEAWRGRTERMLQRAQAAGLAAADIDSALASALLGGMVSEYAYNIYSQQRGPESDSEVITAEVTRIWRAAIFPASAGA